MQYFVSIENCQYMRWQVELLHQSMKSLGIEDDLVVASCPTEDSKKLPWIHVEHENMKKKTGYHAINRTWGLLECLKKGVLKQPFVVMDPDMFFCEKLLETDASICGQNVGYMSYESVKENQGFNLIETKSEWVPIGCIMQFKDVPNTLFEYVHNLLVDMLKSKYKLASKKAYWQREMIAWASAISRYQACGKIKVELTDSYEMHLNPKFYKRKSCVVHYCNGCYPYFDKRYHNNLNWFSLGEPLPFETILNIPIRGFAISKFKEIVNDFIKENKNRIYDL